MFAKDMVTKTDLVKEDVPSDEFIDTTGEGTITIRPGINTITVTNTAMGQLEICKARIEYANPKALTDAAQPYIQFTVDGKKIPLVRAGRCSMPLRVTVGSHTVVERATRRQSTQPRRYEAVWLPDALRHGCFRLRARPGRLHPRRSLGTAVPYSTPGQRHRRAACRSARQQEPEHAHRHGQRAVRREGETLVTYYNRIRKGRIKICKQIPCSSQDSLGGKPFDFNWNVDGRAAR